MLNVVPSSLRQDPSRGGDRMSLSLGSCGSGARYTRQVRGLVPYARRVRPLAARWRMFVKDRYCFCYASQAILSRMGATLRFALRWQLWSRRTRLRLIRLQLRWDRDLVPKSEE